MAALFLESSALVKRYVQEPGSRWMCNLTATSTGHQLFVSRIAGVEVIAAITRKALIGGLTTSDATKAITAFRADFPTGFIIVELTSGLIAEAMRLAEVHHLRAYDAVQLAGVVQLKKECVALRRAAPTLISADLNLNAAAQVEGLFVDDPNTHP